MNTLVKIILVIFIGYVLYIALGVILIALSSPEEKRRLRKEMNKKKREKRAKQIEKKLRLKWYEEPSPGITD